MKLPKQLAKENLESEVIAALDQETIPLYEGAEITIPVLTLNQEMRKQIFYAKSRNEVTIGYEAIDKILTNEIRGLQKQDNTSERVSRLLLTTNDGSPRFYRELECILDKLGCRIMICRLNIDALTMGNVLGFKNTKVKIVLLNRKTTVVSVLKSLLTN